ncbi:LOW QUALITY PROTEIN: adenylyl-sulfate kinase 3-like isoform X2 [Populus alba x Populus x berolinensis]|nr:LOW QUALITY PROTEIN: adenylyl-sulfate kinase 3-like isoform X2 [Populus alba x Populus x berolinensis]
MEEDSGLLLNWKCEWQGGGLAAKWACMEKIITNCREQIGETKIERKLLIIGMNAIVEKIDRQKLLKQKGCVIWITGLSGSGKSTVACALSHMLYQRGNLSYILDGDNIRHGLNRDLSFKTEDRAENIRRVGEVAKLFADAGFICIACLISPYRRDRAECRAMLPSEGFVEVFMDVPLQVCENRDPKGLYKLARAGKIKGFTGIDDPYEPPLDAEIVLQCNTGDCSTPCDMAEKVISYLEDISKHKIAAAITTLSHDVFVIGVLLAMEEAAHFPS